MRQLKGKVKETRKEKRQRKKDNVANKNSIVRVVVPSLAALCIALVLFVYYNSRPQN